MKELSLGYSSCPNDTYIFHALSRGLIEMPFAFKVTMADVESLNGMVRQGLLDVSKISVSAALHVLDKYRLLRSGGAIGRGCGPLVVAKRAVNMKDLRDATMAAPGALTTAHLLLRLNGVHRGPCVQMRFDEIMPAIATGKVDAGVIIHEGRFTYPAYGLSMVLDLGEWWEEETGLPLPLGAIVAKRGLGPEIASTVEAKIRESLLYAQKNPEASREFISNHAREMEPDVIRRHIETFVNEFSVDAGEEGETALKRLLGAACALENIPFSADSLF